MIKITYQCKLCGYETEDEKTVSDHILDEHNAREILEGSVKRWTFESLKLD